MPARALKDNYKLIKITFWPFEMSQTRITEVEISFWSAILVQKEEILHQTAIKVTIVQTLRLDTSTCRKAHKFYSKKTLFSILQQEVAHLSKNLLDFSLFLFFMIKQVMICGQKVQIFTSQLNILFIFSAFYNKSQNVCNLKKEKRSFF